MMSNFIEISSSAEFWSLIKSSDSKLVVIDFSAIWCRPCQIIGPKFQSLSYTYPDALFLKVDVDLFSDVSAAHDVSAMPTFWFYVCGIKAEKMVGGSETKLISYVEKFHLQAKEIALSKDIEFCQSLPCYKELLSNPRELFLDASGLLIKFATNISENPNNEKYRSINLSNKIFQSRLLPVTGAVECLFMMGFEEMDDRLVFPQNTSFEMLHKMRNALTSEQSKQTQATLVVQQPTMQQKDLSLVSPRRLLYIPLMSEPEQQSFYNRLLSSYRTISLYENNDLKMAALNVLPHIQLIEKAKAKHKDINDVSEPDCLLLCLLEWFKADFFKWMDTPVCSVCNQSMKLTGHVTPTTDDLKWGATTVENYLCMSCQNGKRLPRYNHPAKLLQTRIGRCGEWANCFTLFCRAIGFEARFINDWTDHVWTEVYSEGQKRWLHCDPCENKCDSPMIYESGWGKALTYVIAISNEQFVDVTWRYSGKHKNVIGRRGLVSEEWLSSLLAAFNKELRRDIQSARCKVLDERFTVELVEFICPRSVSNDEQVGRQSGSLAWRSLRGETGPPKVKCNEYAFKPTEHDIKQKCLHVSYHSSSDTYNQGNKNMKGWESCIWKQENVTRKIEHDWQMVYLARNEGCTCGSVFWCFDLSSTNMVVDSIAMKMTNKSYENGSVKIELKSNLDDNAQCITMTTGSDELIDKKIFKGETKIFIKVTLTGGKGDVAWQHAQLFRESLDSIENSMDVRIDLVEKNL